MYTLNDYKKAKVELERLNQQWENYSGNNPNKFQTSIAAARSKVRIIETTLKAVGYIPRTPQEELEHRLDSEFPNARSKQIVDFEGKYYIRRFTPLEISLSGKSVTEWSKSWEEVPAKK